MKLNLQAIIIIYDDISLQLTWTLSVIRDSNLSLSFPVKENFWALRGPQISMLMPRRKNNYMSYLCMSLLETSMYPFLENINFPFLSLSITVFLFLFLLEQNIVALTCK